MVAGRLKEIQQEMNTQNTISPNPSIKLFTIYNSYTAWQLLIYFNFSFVKNLFKFTKVL